MKSQAVVRDGKIGGFHVERQRQQGGHRAAAGRRRAAFPQELVRLGRRGLPAALDRPLQTGAAKSTKRSPSAVEEVWVLTGFPTLTSCRSSDPSRQQQPELGRSREDVSTRLLARLSAVYPICGSNQLRSSRKRLSPSCTVSPCTECTVKAYCSSASTPLGLVSP